MNNLFSEEQPAPVEPVDLVVKRTLERVEVPYQPADWTLLQTRLNQGALVRRIRLSKLAEAAIFLLLLINIEGFLGGFGEVLKPTAPQTPKSNIPMADGHRSKTLKHRAAATPSTDISGVVALAERVVELISAPFGSDNISPVATSNASSLTAVPSTVFNTSVLDASHFYSTSGMVPFNAIAPLPHAKTPDFAWRNFLETIPGVIIPAPRKSNGLYAASFASFDQNKFRANDFSNS